MKTTTFSTLTTGIIADALSLLQAVQDLKTPVGIEQLAPLQVRALFVASALRIHSGIDEVRVEVRREEA